ncbi:MAG: MerR family redox-sensitive transcriptional activator SoxR [Cryomorphaceae bacterium]|jgi:MerR family redox-sensitive transcriptional activator SoxR
MKNDPLLNIGAVAKRTGSKVSAIRFYEGKGLVPSVRSSSGHRLFHRSSIRRISFILVSQRLGYSLKEISTALGSLPNNRTPNKADWDKLSRCFSKDIESRIQQLRALQDSLIGCMGCGCLSLNKCRLYNPQDQIASKGNGPRYLLGDKPESN